MLSMHRPRSPAAAVHKGERPSPPRAGPGRHGSGHVEKFTPSPGPMIGARPKRVNRFHNRKEGGGDKENMDV